MCVFSQPRVLVDHVKNKQPLIPGNGHINMKQYTGHPAELFYIFLIFFFFEPISCTAKKLTQEAYETRFNFSVQIY